MLFTHRIALGSLPSQCLSHPTNTALPLAHLQQKRAISTRQLDAEQRGRERIVILGSGWAGFTLSRELDPKKYQIVIVSPRSYFCFTPLLASTSVGTLEFRTALEPVRSFRGRRQQRVYYQGWAESVDFERRTLAIEEAVEDQMQGRALVGDRHASKTAGEREGEKAVEAKKGQLFDLTWDKLLVTVGCYVETFGTPGVRENAYFLKDVGDARRIRNRLLSCFETAALPTTPVETRKQLLNFAVVGGGPTGIEWSAELHDLIYQDMKRLYPELIEHVQITVYDVAPKVLSMFDASLSKYAMQSFARSGIAIKTSHHVEELRRGLPGRDVSANPDVKDPITGYTLKLKESGEIGVGMVVWSTGLMTNPFVAHALHAKVALDEKTGGILTNARLQAQAPDGSAIPSVYALGDCAVLEGTSYPATAQVASQKASWLAKRLNKGDIEMGEGFTYKDLGVMAYIGNEKAILQGKGGNVSGRLAWLVWRGAYLTKTVSWRNKILVPVFWAVNWVFGRDISRF